MIPYLPKVGKNCPKHDVKLLGKKTVIPQQYGNVGTRIMCNHYLSNGDFISATQVLVWWNTADVRDSALARYLVSCHARQTPKSTESTVASNNGRLGSANLLASVKSFYLRSTVSR